MTISYHFAHVGVVYGDQRAVCWNQFSLSIMWGWDWSQVVRLARKCLYLVSKLNAPGCVWWVCGCVIVCVCMCIVWCPSSLLDYMKRNLFCCCCSIWLIFLIRGRRLTGMYPMKDMKLPHSYLCTMSHFADWILQWCFIPMYMQLCTPNPSSSISTQWNFEYWTVCTGSGWASL